MNIRLHLENGRLIDLPANSVGSIIGVGNNPPSDRPDAKAIIFYDFGTDEQIAFVAEDSVTVFNLLQGASPAMAASWMPLHDAHDTHYLQAHSLVRMLEVDPEANAGCAMQIHFRPTPGGKPRFVFVVETMGDIDKMREPAPLPTPSAAPAPAPRRGKK